LLSRRGDVRFTTSEMELYRDPDTHFPRRRGEPVKVEVTEWRLAGVNPFRAKDLVVRTTTRPAPGP